MGHSRFHLGDTVYVRDAISPFYSEEGRILAVLVNKQEHSPDQYDVVFADGHSEVFWDAQLDMK
jgi:hypothetical protein